MEMLGYDLKWLREGIVWGSSGRTGGVFIRNLGSTTSSDGSGVKNVPARVTGGACHTYERISEERGKYPRAG